MTLAIPQVSDPEVQQALDVIALQFPLGNEDIANGVLKLATTGTARKIAFGSSTVAFSASSNVTKTITHGLGTTPTVAFAIPVTPSGVTPYTAAVDGSTAATSTQATFRLNTNPSTTTVTATVTFYWVVLG